MILFATAGLAALAATGATVWQYWNGDPVRAIFWLLATTTLTRLAGWLYREAEKAGEA